MRLTSGAAAALCIVSALAVACSGGGDGGAKPSATSPPVATSTPASTVPAASAGVDGTAAPAPTPAVRASSVGDFKDAAEKFADSRFTAEYHIVSDGSPDGFQNGTAIVYKDGAGRFRFDINATQGGGDVSGIFIDAGENRGFCLAQAGDFGELFGVDPSQGICFRTDPNVDGGAGDLTGDFDTITENLKDARNPTERDIVGISAQCATVSQAEGGDRDVCFSESGALLYVGDATSVTFEATKVTDSADASAFDFPYEVHDAPGQGG